MATGINRTMTQAGQPVPLHIGASARPFAGVSASRPVRRTALMLLFDALCIATALALIYHDLGYDLLFVAGSYSVGINEPLLVLLTACITAAITTSRPRPGVTALNRVIFASVILFIGIMMLGLLRGIAIDPMLALFDLRALLSTPLYMMLGILIADKPILIGRIVQTIKILALVIGAIVISRLLFHFPSSAAYVADPRPMLNYGALCLGIAAMLWLSQGLRSRRLGTVIGACFMMLICIRTGQGTASASTFIGFLTIMAFERGAMATERRVISLLGLFLIAASWLFSDQVVALLQSNKDIAAFLTNRENTNDTRHDLWAAFFTNFENRSIFDKIFGIPLGQNEPLFINRWGGVYWQATLHNMYFETVRKVGVASIAAYISALLGSLALLIKSRKPDSNQFSRDYVSKIAAVALIFTIFIFGYSYDLRAHASVFLMLIVATACSHAFVPSKTQPFEPRRGGA